MGLDQLSDSGLATLKKYNGDVTAATKDLSLDDLFVLRDQALAEKPKERGLGEQVGRAALSAIPAVAGIGGAMLGSPGGPAGSLAGGALGYAGGRQVEQGLGSMIFGDQLPQTRGELYGGAAKDIAVGAASEVGGQVVGQLAGAVGRGAKSLGKSLGQAYEYTKATPKPNAEQILAAGKTVGVAPTKGMLVENPLVGQIESGLAQSGSIPAMEIRTQQELLGKQLDSAKGMLSDKAVQQTAYETGNLAKQNIEQIVQLNKTPVSKMYDELEPQFLKIPINQNRINRELGILKKETFFKTKDGEQVLNQVADDLSKLDNLADLKEYRTNLLRSLPQTASDLDRMRVGAVYDRITSLRDNSIASLQRLDEFKFAPGGGKDVIEGVQGQIKAADAAHAKNMDALNKVRHLFGQKEPFKSSSEFVKKIQDIPNQNLTEKVFSSGNVNELNTFANQFPEAFGQMKVQKFSDMIQKSTNREGFNFNQFQKAYEKMDPNIRDLVFDAETKSYIDALKTVFESLPNRLGPSGTPQGIMTMGALDTGRIVNDMWAKYVYKNATPQGAMILQSASKNLGSLGESLQQPMGALPFSARAIPQGLTAVERRKQILEQGAK